MASYLVPLVKIDGYFTDIFTIVIQAKSESDAAFKAQRQAFEAGLDCIADGRRTKKFED